MLVSRYLGEYWDPEQDIIYSLSDDISEPKSPTLLPEASGALAHWIDAGYAVAYDRETNECQAGTAEIFQRHGITKTDFVRVNHQGAITFTGGYTHLLLMGTEQNVLDVAPIVFKGKTPPTLETYQRIQEEKRAREAAEEAKREDRRRKNAEKKRRKAERKAEEERLAELEAPQREAEKKRLQEERERQAAEAQAVREQARLEQQAEQERLAEKRRLAEQHRAQEDAKIAAANRRLAEERRARRAAANKGSIEDSSDEDHPDTPATTLDVQDLAKKRTLAFMSPQLHMAFSELPESQQDAIRACFYWGDWAKNIQGKTLGRALRGLGFTYPSMDSTNAKMTGVVRFSHESGVSFCLHFKHGSSDYTMHSNMAHYTGKQLAGKTDYKTNPYGLGIVRPDKWTPSESWPHLAEEHIISAQDL